MKLPDIFTTTAMRMAIRYSLIYTLILAVVFAAFLWSTKGAVEPEIETALINEQHVLMSHYEQGGLSALSTLIKERANKTETFLYLLMDSKRNILAGNLLQLPEDFEVSEDLSNILFEQEILPRMQFDDDAYLFTFSWLFSDGSILIITHSSPQAEMLLEISEYLLEFIGAAILLSLLIGVTLGYSILHRIKTITNTADKIIMGDITQRIPLSHKQDEFDELSSQLNTMMDRIQKLINSIREVSDNVAHDLRSPLTRLRNNFEVTLLEERSNEAYRNTLNQGVEDVESLLKTFNALLSIAQVESGNHRSQWRTVNVNRLLMDIVELYAPLAEEKKQTLRFKSHESEISLIANRNLLAQAFSNLIENAIKYTPELGHITILATCINNNTVEITFTDSGSGIPVNEYEHVLERFVRLDNSRNTPGNGLGLSLVSAVCELHHGSLRFADAKPGLMVTMCLQK